MKSVFCMTVFLLLFIEITSINAQTKYKNARSVKIAEVAREINLNAGDIELFKIETRKKVDEFQEYIIILSNKNESRERRDLAEREAMKLFFEGAIMETSFLQPDGNVTIKSRLMNEYLYRLKVLPYTKITIEFYDIAYVSSFTKGVDGRFYATASIFQKFTGFTGDNIDYSDITKKDIEIIVDLVDDPFYNEKHWKVFLGDIRATETKPLASK